MIGEALSPHASAFDRIHSRLPSLLKISRNRFYGMLRMLRSFWRVLACSIPTDEGGKFQPHLDISTSILPRARARLFSGYLHYHFNTDMRFVLCSCMFQGTVDVITLHQSLFYHLAVKKAVEEARQDQEVPDSSRDTDDDLKVAGYAASFVKLMRAAPCAYPRIQVEGGEIKVSQPWKQLNVFFT